MLTTIFKSWKGLKKMRKKFLIFFPARMGFTTKKHHAFFFHLPPLTLKMHSLRFFLPVRKLMCSLFSLLVTRESKQAVFIFARGNLNRNGFQQLHFRLPDRKSTRLN